MEWVFNAYSVADHYYFQIFTLQFESRSKAGQSSRRSGKRQVQHLYKVSLLSFSASLIDIWSWFYAEFVVILSRTHLSSLSFGAAVVVYYFLLSFLAAIVIYPHRCYFEQLSSFIIIVVILSSRLRLSLFIVILSTRHHSSSLSSFWAVVVIYPHCRHFEQPSSKIIICCHLSSI